MVETTENQAYLTRQLITYLGNKRALLDFIGRGVREIQSRLGREKLTFADVFSGSGVVSRFFKQRADFILANDLERYCAVISQCYLANPDQRALAEAYEGLLCDMAAHPVTDGFIRRLYAPRDAQDIQKGERVFYTPENARFLDTCRAAIGRLPASLQPYFLAPLLSEASIKCNTSGVFKGFYKDPRTGRGAWGGRGANALSRILAPIELPFPVFSNFTCPFAVTQMDALQLAGQMEPVDVAYLDPPYNQHPYGSNYFMLDLLCTYKEPPQGAISRVSGIPRDWNRSVYNSPGRAKAALGQLCQQLPARFLLISFNSEGFISPDEMRALLGELGSVTVFDTAYNTFRGARNLHGRTIHLSEYLYLVDKHAARL